ncbi:white collar 2 type of transcription factor, variant 2 [Balamuthia mandrillaris]
MHCSAIPATQSSTQPQTLPSLSELIKDAPLPPAPPLVLMGEKLLTRRANQQQQQLQQQQQFGFMGGHSHDKIAVETASASAASLLATASLPLPAGLSRHSSHSSQNFSSLPMLATAAHMCSYVPLSSAQHMSSPSQLSSSSSSCSSSFSTHEAMASSSSPACKIPKALRPRAGTAFIPSSTNQPSQVDAASLPSQQQQQAAYTQQLLSAAPAAPPSATLPVFPTPSTATAFVGIPPSASAAAPTSSPSHMAVSSMSPGSSAMTPAPSNLHHHKQQPQASSSPFFMAAAAAAATRGTGAPHTASPPDPTHLAHQYAALQQQALAANYNLTTYHLALAALAHQQGRTKTKKHKRVRRRLRKKPRQRVCSHCNATDTPEWRSGPLGRGTLCNAYVLHLFIHSLSLSLSLSFSYFLFYL